MSTPDIIVGLDAGTSVIKAVAFDLQGRELGLAQCRNQVLYGRDGAAEQDVLGTWEAAAQTLRALAERVDNLSGRIAALTVTGQGDGTWLIDDAGEPVGQALLWLDARSAPIIERWRGSEVGPAFYAITGTGLNPANQSGHLAWLREHRREWLQRAATAFHCKDWLYFKLTGVRATDPAEALFTFGDYRTGEYSPEVLKVLGLDDLGHLLPDIVDGTRRRDGLSEAAARLVGLPAGTPVILAPVDILCSSIGAAIFDAERQVGCTVIGSTGAHMRLRHSLDEIVLNDQQVGYTMVFPMEGTWAQIVLNMAATLNIDWLLDLVSEVAGIVGVDETDRRRVLDALESRLDCLLASSEPDQVLYHPYIAPGGERGPFVNPWACAQFTGLRADTQFIDLVRAVYEGIGFAARDCYEVLGRDVDEIRLAGGAANSPHCRQIIAAALNAPIRRTQRAETGAAGAAALAAVALGCYPSLAEACADWVDPFVQPPEMPVPELSERYAQVFPIYQLGYRHAQPVWQAMRTLGSGPQTGDR